MRQEIAKKIRIEEKGIGAGEPTFIIAEIDSNHDGKLDQAKQLIDEAARIGADAVKFQSFRADHLVTPQQEAVYQAVKGCELPQEWHRQLAVYARERHIIFLSTAFDEESADLLFNLEMPAFKVASGDLTHIPLLRHVARSGGPSVSWPKALGSPPLPVARRTSWTGTTRRLGSSGPILSCG